MFTPAKGVQPYAPTENVWVIVMWHSVTKYAVPLVNYDGNARTAWLLVSIDIIFRLMNTNSTPFHYPQHSFNRHPAQGR